MKSMPSFAPERFAEHEALQALWLLDRDLDLERMARPTLTAREVLKVTSAAAARQAGKGGRMQEPR